MNKLPNLLEEVVEAPAGSAPVTTSAPEMTTPAATEAPASAGSDVDWMEISHPDESQTDATPSGRGTPAAKVETPAPVKPLPETPISQAEAAPAVPAIPAQVTPPAQPQAVTQPTETPPAQPDLAALRTQEIERLTQVYQLSEEDSRLALTQPEAVFPKLAANLHVSVLDSVVNTILARVPDVIRAVQTQDTTTRSNEDAFYSQWPQLKDEKYKDTVYRAVAAYRHLNPKAPKEEVIRAAGLQAMITLRLPIPRELLEVPAEQPKAPGFQPVAPAGSGATPVTARPGGPPNPFAVLASEFLDEDAA